MVPESRKASGRVYLLDEQTPLQELPGDGLDEVAQRLNKYRNAVRGRGYSREGVAESIMSAVDHGVVGSNISCCADSPPDQAIEDFVVGVRKLGPLSDYIVLNICPPWAPNDLSSDPERLRELLAAVVDARDSLDLSEDPVDSLSASPTSPHTRISTLARLRRTPSIFMRSEDEIKERELQHAERMQQLIPFKEGAENPLLLAMDLQGRFVQSTTAAAKTEDDDGARGEEAQPKGFLQRLHERLWAPVDEPADPLAKVRRELKELGPKRRNLARGVSSGPVPAEYLETAFGSSQRHVPLLVKVSPDLSPEQCKQVADLCMEFALDGMVISDASDVHPAAQQQGKLHVFFRGGDAGWLMIPPPPCGSAHRTYQWRFSDGSVDKFTR